MSKFTVQEKSASSLLGQDENDLSLLKHRSPSPFSILPIPLTKKILSHISYFSDIPHLRLVCKTWSKAIDQILFTRIIDNFSKLYPIVATLTLRCHDHSKVITEHEIQMELRTIPKPEKYTTKFMIEFLPITTSLKKPLIKDLFKNVEAFFKCYYIDENKYSFETKDKCYIKEESDDISKADKNSDKGKNKTKTKDNFPDIIKDKKRTDDNNCIGVKTKMLKEVEISEIIMLSLGTCTKSQNFSHEIAADLAIEFQCVSDKPMTFSVKSVGFRPLFVICWFKNFLKNDEREM
ncbi:17633_t:CDS:2 [Dentiscutata erythropus]|uniref:17633_t:CDS:1 n=1 Tax=Dentiscutata erythropus TaxID=1348616 RepID=A0A9N9CBE3_9GLOM|nr:17633_t:CDS:2 [Dentiscutata erythropus]